MQRASSFLLPLSRGGRPPTFPLTSSDTRATFLGMARLPDRSMNVLDAVACGTPNHELRLHLESTARRLGISLTLLDDPVYGYGVNTVRTWGAVAYWDASKKAYFSAMHELGHAAFGHTLEPSLYRADIVENEARASMWAFENASVEPDTDSVVWLRLAFHSYEIGTGRGVTRVGPDTERFFEIVRQYDPHETWLTQWDSFKEWAVSSIVAGARRAAEDELRKTMPPLRWPTLLDIDRDP